MDIFTIMVIILHFTFVISKSRRGKYDTSSSDETIENLLYFKDCQKKPTEQTTTTTHKIVPLRMPIQPPPTTPPQPECPFPKMCCALSCGNECGANVESSFVNRQMDAFSNFPHPSIEPMPRNMQQRLSMPPQIRKRKKLKFPAGKIQPPIDGRRDSGFAKAKIKSLISEDDDIRKILKDLVRVTMQKADLLEMIKAEKTGVEPADIGEINLPITTEADENYDEYIE